MYILENIIATSVLIGFVTGVAILLLVDHDIPDWIKVTLLSMLAMCGISFLGGVVGMIWI